MAVYIPLRPGEKIAAVSGWARPEYEGVDHQPGDWNALRADGLVIVDVDSTEAMHAWQRVAGDGVYTLTVKTPRGWHYYYAATPGSPEGPAVGVYPGTDIRAGRGSYVVAPQAEGYPIWRTEAIRPFNPLWLPRAEGPRRVGAVHEWDRIREGQRNNTLAGIGGYLRRQGASPEAIARALAALNAVLVDPPLDLDEVRLLASSTGRYDPRPDPVVELTDDDE